MSARIYKPAKTAMSSGQANTKSWVLEFDPEEAKQIDPLMGWAGSGDMNTQVKLHFDSRDAAVEYATRHGIAHRVQDPRSRRKTIRPRGYGENFAFNRRGAWTH
ncbi:MAG: ETC complex I subunit [Pseudomonadota bacterium]